MVAAGTGDDRHVITLEQLEPATNLLVMQFLVTREKPLECLMVNVDSRMASAEVDIEIPSDSKDKAEGFALMRAPAKLLGGETMGEGGKQPLGTVVVLLVENAGGTMEGGGIDGDEEVTREVRDASKCKARERTLENSD